MTLTDYATQWKDTPEYHHDIHEAFCEFVKSDDSLYVHRRWVEGNHFGFGEMSFHWMWKLIVDEMPEVFSFCEIGVFRGQVLSLIKLLAERTGRKAYRYGVGPMSPIGIGWDSDYFEDVRIIHDYFDLATDYTIIHGLSENHLVIEETKSYAKFDILFVDGGHEYETVVSDLCYYTDMVKVGGYLVIDDACCNLNFPPSGYFTGIEPVTRAVLEWEQTELGKQFKFVFNVVHDKIYRRIA